MAKYSGCVVTKIFLVCLTAQACLSIIICCEAYCQPAEKTYVTALASGDTTVTDSIKLKLLTWNLQMLPAVMFKKHQVARAKAIAGVLAQTDYDFIVFQEAFHRRARKIIWNRVSESYPYQYGPEKGGFPKVNGGVWIISRIPLQNEQAIKFKKCSRQTMDCRARKGAIFVTLIKNDQKFQIIGTHVQSAEGERYQQTRKSQFLEISEDLIKPRIENKVPLLITGDLNTRKKNTTDYTNMLHILDAYDGDLSGDNQCTFDGSINDFAKSDEPGSIIDYILVNTRGVQIKSIKREVKIFQKPWSKKNKDLSDHFAVQCELIF